ncbi:unnamed protein product [Ectocarpus fasciculatus]
MAMFGPVNPADSLSPQDAGENGERIAVGGHVRGAHVPMARGGGSPTGCKEEKDSPETEQGPFLRRQKSAPPGGIIEMAQRLPRPRSASFPARAPVHTVGRGHDASEANNRPGALTATAWPGKDFRLEQVLPGSVYLWACGERGEGDGPSPVSRPEAVAAWVVLISQAVCYAGLWAITGNQPPTDSQTSSVGDDDHRDYSILAIAGAMYLLLTIVAADLWGGCALCLEGLGSADFAWCTRRRAFGACLLGTFVALIGASIRVLFYSSFENMELVIGAAAVLFIADVDEKVMVVLKNVRGRWRLFWVLEAIGLSFFLAMLAIKVTGNGTIVSSHSSIRCDEWACWYGSFYAWFFILFLHPTSVTVFSLMVSSFVSTPVGRGPLSCVDRSPRGLTFGCLMLCWSVIAIAQVSVGETVFPEYVALGCSIPIVLCRYRELRTHLIQGLRRFRTTVHQRPRKYLLFGGLVVIALTSVFSCLGDVGDPAVDFLDAFLFLALEAWLVSGLFAACGVPAADISPTMRIMWFITGCGSVGALCVVEGMWWLLTFVSSLHFTLLQLGYLSWVLIVGTFLWGEKSGTYGVAFWAAVSVLRLTIIGCSQTWLGALFDGAVK